jgi:hypothetical protein
MADLRFYLHRGFFEVPRAQFEIVYDFVLHRLRPSRGNQVVREGWTPILRELQNQHPTIPCPTHWWRRDSRGGPRMVSSNITKN